ncbi:MAG: c-type cytochrome [Burkholderiaceae bacterium]
MIKSLALAAAIVTVTVGASVSVAADGPFTKAIKARQGLMQVAGFNLGMLAAMAKGKQDYDATLASEAAANVLRAAQMNHSTLWPEGSDLTNKELTQETVAKPEAWSTYPEISNKHKAWLEASEKLAAVAGDGLDALKPAVGGVGKSCKGCHDDFRQKK